MTKKIKDVIVGLVVEDERPLAEAIKTKLEADNFEIVTARTINQALDLLKEVTSIKFIWLDHYLIGNKTGLDFLAEIKSHQIWKKIPVYVVSNTASKQNELSYLELGIQNYYVKANHSLEEIVSNIKKDIVENYVK